MARFGRGLVLEGFGCLLLLGMKMKVWWFVWIFWCYWFQVCNLFCVHVLFLQNLCYGFFMFRRRCFSLVLPLCVSILVYHIQLGTFKHSALWCVLAFSFHVQFLYIGCCVSIHDNCKVFDVLCALQWV